MSLSIKAGRIASQGGMAGRVRQGDPGLWGAIKGAVGGLITGGPIGAITGGIGGLIGRDSRPQQQVSMPVPEHLMPGRPQRGFTGALHRAALGGHSGFVTNGERPPSGYRLNKSAYFLKDGTYVEKGTRWVKIRRRNSMNPRALSRAIARVDGGKRIQATLSKISTAKYTASGRRKSCPA